MTYVRDGNGGRSDRDGVGAGQGHAEIGLREGTTLLCNDNGNNKYKTMIQYFQAYPSNSRYGENSKKLCLIAKSQICSPVLLLSRFHCQD